MVIKFISPLLLTVPPLSIGSQMLHRNLIEFNLLKRYQYTLSYLTSSTSLQSNKKCPGLKRLSCTLQTRSPIVPDTYMPILKGRKTKKYRYKYASMPRVATTHDLNLIELHSQMLLNGYRPLSFGQEEELEKEVRMTPGDNTTMYEVSLDLTHLNGLKNIWKSSAAGVEKYVEWDGIPLHVVQNLKPFVPPQTEKVDDIHAIDPHGLLKQICEMIHKDIILSKKKNNNN